MSCRNHWSAVLILPLIVTTIPMLGQQLSAPDAGLYTTYSMDYAEQILYWSVCGSTSFGSTGCYGGGSLGPFGKLGAMIESNPTVSGNTVTRMIYVVDTAAGTSGTGVTLYAYNKTDTVTTTDDTVIVTLTKTVNLPLAGGANTLCSMAATPSTLFIGTNQSEQAVTVRKSTLTANRVQVYFNGINVSAITVDRYGYVTVAQGDFSAGSSGSVTFTSSGAAISSGGGALFMLDTTMGVSIADLPPASASSPTLIGITPSGMFRH